MLTDQQKTRYNRYRATGLSKEEALKTATMDSDNQYNPALRAGVDNVLLGEKSLASSVVDGAKEAAFGGFREVYEDTQKYGAAIAVAKSPLSLLAGAGRGVEKVIGGVLETADDLTGETVSGAVLPHLQDFAESEIGQSLADKAGKFNDATYGVAGDLFDIAALTGVTGVAKSGAAKSIKEGLLQGFNTSQKKAVHLRDTVVKKSPVAPKTTPVEAEQHALKAAAELLQSGSKKNAKGRIEQFNNADKQAMQVIRDSDAPLNSQQDLVKFFDTSVETATKERTKLLQPFLSNEVTDGYLSLIKAEIKKLRTADELDEAAAYAKLLKKEKDFFTKIGKEAHGGKNTVAQLDARVKELNKKVSKLYNDVGGKENLLPDQKIEAQAYDLLRKGVKQELDEIAGDAYKDAGLKSSGLQSAREFAEIQRDRAKNALSGTPWEKMSTTQRAAFIKDLFPTLKDFGVRRLIKLDTKADVLDGLVAEKVRLIREFGKDALGGQ